MPREDRIRIKNETQSKLLNEFYLHVSTCTVKFRCFRSLLSNTFGQGSDGFK